MAVLEESLVEGIRELGAQAPFTLPEVLVPWPILELVGSHVLGRLQFERLTYAVHRTAHSGKAGQESNATGQDTLGA